MFDDLGSYQDRYEDWLQVINFNMTSIDDQTFVPGSVDPIDNKITIRIDQDTPNIHYSDTLGLRFKIPYSLDAYWDVENTNIEVISQSDNSDIEIGEIYFSNNQGTDLNPKYKYIDLILLNDFKNSEFVVLDGFYINPVSPSNGRLSVSLDGSANSLIVFDNKTKYVADMDVFMSDSRKYFVNDTDEFSELPSLNIKESLSASIISQSIIYFDLPNGIFWNEQSVIDVANMNINRFQIEKDPNLESRIKIFNIDIDLDETIQIQGLKLDNLTSESIGNLNYTIDYSAYNENPLGTNTVTILGDKAINVLDPSVSLNSFNDNIPYALNDSTHIFNILLDNKDFFDNDYKLVLNLSNNHLDYIEFIDIDSPGLNYSIDESLNNQLSITVSNEDSIAHIGSLLSIPLHIKYKNDFCSLSEDDFALLKSGVENYLVFSYEYNGMINTNTKNSENLVSLFSPIIPNSSVNLNYDNNGNSDISFFIQKDMNLENIDSLFSLQSDTYNFNFSSNDILGNSNEDSFFCEESGNSVNYQEIKMSFTNDYSEIVLNSCVNDSENDICQLSLVPNRNNLINNSTNYSNDKLIFNIEGHGGDGTISEGQINEDYFECSVDFEIHDMVQDVIACNYEQITWSEDVVMPLFNNCVESLGSTVLAVYVYENNCIRSNSLPLALQFVQDITPPSLLTSFENLNAIGKNNSGHEYFYEEIINIEFVDDLIVEDGLIYFNNGISDNYINLSDTLSITYTINWNAEGYSDQIIGDFQCDQGIESNECNFDMTFENLLEMDLNDNVMPFINNVDKVRTSIEFRISDALKNEKIETIYFTVLFDENGVLSDDIYNFPNPFNNKGGSGTTIRYMLTQNISYGNFIVLDASGKTVLRRPLESNDLLKGTHYINWNGNDASSRRLSSGIYFGFIELEGEVKKRLKMVIRNK